MIVLGCDVAGPSNLTDSALMVFAQQDAKLILLQHRPHFSDDDFAQILMQHHHEDEAMIIGLDAPLSYNPGGGDRPADTALRRRLIEAGLKPGTVMPPTFQRMAYLTLRGICLARLANQLQPEARIVEVHPAGAMILRDADREAVRTLKQSAVSREILQIWLAEQGLRGLEQLGALRDHDLAAAAAALAAWQWSAGQSAWCSPAQPPHHPFDYAC